MGASIQGSLRSLTLGFSYSRRSFAALAGGSTAACRVDVFHATLRSLRQRSFKVAFLTSAFHPDFPSFQVSSACSTVNLNRPPQPRKAPPQASKGLQLLWAFSSSRKRSSWKNGGAQQQAGFLRFQSRDNLIKQSYIHRHVLFNTEP